MMYPHVITRSWGTLVLVRIDPRTACALYHCDGRGAYIHDGYRLRVAR